MSSEIHFTKDNLDTYLKELAKEFRKLNGKQTPAEIILIGGAAVLANYGFRDMTYDVDAIIHASSAMKTAINNVGDKLGLPNGWLNNEFKRTSSYSSELVGASEYYKTFSNVLQVRTIRAEYLIAMKLMSGRQYKNDLSDIAGILADHAEHDNPILLDDIKAAVIDLYGSWEMLPAFSRNLIVSLFESGINKYKELYNKYKADEKLVRESLIELENAYPDAVNKENVNSIIEQIKERLNKPEQ